MMPIQIERIAAGDLYEDSPAAHEFCFCGRGDTIFTVVITDEKAHLFGREPKEVPNGVLACLITGRWPCEVERVEPDSFVKWEGQIQVGHGSLV